MCAGDAFFFSKVSALVHVPYKTVQKRPSAVSKETSWAGTKFQKSVP